MWSLQMVNKPSHEVALVFFGATGEREGGGHSGCCCRPAPAISRALRLLACVVGEYKPAPPSLVGVVHQHPVWALPVGAAPQPATSGGPPEDQAEGVAAATCMPAPTSTHGRCAAPLSHADTANQLAEECGEGEYEHVVEARELGLPSKYYLESLAKGGRRRLGLWARAACRLPLTSLP